MSKYFGLINPKRYYHLLGLKTGLSEEKIQEIFEALVDLIDQEFNTSGYAYIPKIALLRRKVRHKRVMKAGYYPSFNEPEVDPETGALRPKMKYFEERVYPERVRVWVRWSNPFIARLVPKPKGYKHNAKRHQNC